MLPELVNKNEFPIILYSVVVFKIIFINYLAHPRLKENMCYFPDQCLITLAHHLTNPTIHKVLYQCYLGLTVCILLKVINIFLVRRILKYSSFQGQDISIQHMYVQ